MKQIRTVLFLLFLFAPLTWGYDVAYRVSMPNPNNHSIHIQITIGGMTTDNLDLQLPAWSPERYRIMDFARNVSQFSASNGESPLSFQKTDKSTWRVNNNGAKRIEVNYKVYADNLSGEYSQLNDQHAFLDGAGIYMYIVDAKSNPVSLSIEPPEGWMILSSAGELGETEFEFPNYDRMADELVQLGKFFLYKFDAGDTEIYVSIVNNGDREPVDKFLDQIMPIARTTVDMLGPLDTDRFTFFYHFLPDTRNTTGMEHLNCFQISRNHDLEEDNWKSDLTPWITAHEFVHAWNVKRLRPKGLGPFDYSKEVYTPLLWFAEGCTNYLADLIMVRSGAWSQDEFYEWLADRIELYRSLPGAYERSAEDASFDAWLDTPHAGVEWNPQYVWIDYYLKGEMVGLCIDMEIRKRTKNNKRFEDWVKLLYQRFYENAEDESYYLKGKGFTTGDLLQALEDLTESDWDDNFKQWVQTPGDLPIEEALNVVGVNLKNNDTEPTTPYTGLHFSTAPGGYPKIEWIEKNSPAFIAGLSRHDVIVALDAERTYRNEFDAVLRRQGRDQLVTATILRDDRMLTKHLRLVEGWNQQEYLLVDDESVSSRIKHRREDWLEGALSD